MLAVLAVAMTACSSSPPELKYERSTVDGQGVLGAFKTATPIRAVIVFFHGMDRDENIIDLDQPHRELVRALTDAGYAVVASRAGGNAFGNAASQRNYAALARESSQHYKTKDIYFLSESMGTVAAMNVLAKDTGVSVRGLAAINPLLNLGYIPPTYQSAVQASSVGVVLSTVNPLEFPLSELAGKYLRFYVTPSDSVVPGDPNFLAFQKRFGSVAHVSMATCHGDHLDPSCIQGTDLVQWFDSLQT